MMKKFKIKISDKIISENNPTFVIAEIGINHRGNKKLCLKLIDQAINCGADAVKIQIVDYKDSYSKNSSSFKIFKKNYLRLKDIEHINNYCRKKNIIFFATPSGDSAINILKKTNFPAVKISSSLLNNTPYLKKISRTIKKPYILSTGMAYLSEIKESSIILSKQKIPYILLKCTSQYPADDKNLNLNSISTIKKKFKCLVGYSDHTKDNLACLSAVSKGAKVIEKHFNVYNNKSAPDDKISAKPKQFKELVNQIRRIDIMKGNSMIFPSKIEIKNRDNNLRKIVAKKKIKKGELFTIDNVGLLRSNKKHGLPPKNFENFLNKKSLKNIKAYSLLKLNFIS